MGLRRSDNFFVVRTWLESEHDPGTMRGRIEHAGSGRCRYFANFGDLCDFIVGAQRFGASSERAGGGYEPEAVDGPETIPG